MRYGARALSRIGARLPRHHLQQGATDLRQPALGAEQSKAGTVRALGVTSPQRWPGVPDVPAIAETVPGFESVGFYGISAPKGTPPEIVDILNKAVNEALKDPKLVAQLASVGGIPKPMTPAEFGKLLSDETEKWRKVVEFAGVSVD